MAPASKAARILRASRQAIEEESDALAVEAPLEIALLYPDAKHGRLVDYPLSVTMRTPGDDRALVTGLLFCEGLIESADWIEDCPADDSHLTVRLNRPPKENPARRQRRFLAASACGVCGKTDLANLLVPESPDFSPTAPLLHTEVLQSLPHKLREAQKGFTATGGMHAAARFDMAGNCHGLFEDVGRHNALDKLIGDRLRRHGPSPIDEVLLVSGRVSYELVQKALAAGFPILAAIGAPSSLAVEMSNAARQTLVGFLRSDRYNVYSHPQRLTSA